MALGIKKKNEIDESGIILFEKVEYALHAEKILKKQGYAIKLVAPPARLRKGCDLALEINISQQAGIERIFAQHDIAYTGIAPLKGDMELLGIVRITDFENAVMVKAGNMKLTFEKKTGIILNTSGGGCPDIPYLHHELVGKRLCEAPRPRDLGYTLCALMLDRAFTESLSLFTKGPA